MEMPLQRSTVCNTEMGDKVTIKNDCIITFFSLFGNYCWCGSSLVMANRAPSPTTRPARTNASCFTLVPRRGVMGRIIYASAWRMTHQTGRCQFLPSFPVTAVFILRVISFQISLSWVVYWKQARAFVTCSWRTLCLGDFPQIHKGEPNPGSIFLELHVSTLFNGHLKCFYLISRESSPTKFDLRWDRSRLASGMVLDHSLIPHFVGILLHTRTHWRVPAHTHTWMHTPVIQPESTSFEE